MHQVDKAALSRRGPRFDHAFAYIICRHCWANLIRLFESIEGRKANAEAFPGIEAVLSIYPVLVSVWGRVPECSLGSRTRDAERRTDDIFETH